MYLKALEIQGFKSFPDKTRLTFEKDITAIVGPNGSGKSNISDAILWVMGEQRSRALRGSRMEDVIFGGTEKRGKLGFAQVTLVVDNTEHIFSMEASEVMITRRYYRSGESEYFINREAVRLRDVHALLMDTGLGRDGYSIIGQGRIDEIISTKSTDRREIFEEAAGISRYRYSKEESERKLEKTDENLLRIKDKIDEVELQVEPLRKQSETAKKYLLLRDELRVVEVSVWLENLDRLREQSGAAENDYNAAKQNLDAAHAELDAIYKATENYSEKMSECDVEAERVRALLSETETTLAECDSATKVLRVTQSNNAESIERLRREIDERADRADGIRAQIAGHQARIEEIALRCAELTDEQAALLESERENNETGSNLRAELAALVSKESELTSEISRHVTALSMLSDSTDELKARETSIADETEQAEEKLSQIEARIRDDRIKARQAQELVKEQENRISGYRLRLTSREDNLKKCTELCTKLTIDARSMDGRIRMLTEMEKEMEGYSKAVRTIVNAANNGVLHGIHGPIAKLIETDDRYTLAIETALGAAMQNIVVDDQERGRDAIAFLKQRDSGRATFLPVSVIRGQKLSRVPNNEDGCYGLALSLVRFDAQYTEIMTNLLGRTVVAENMGAALRIARKNNNSFRIVTLDGQIINAGGSMTGGSSAKGTGVLSRANERSRLLVQRETLEKRIKEENAKLVEAQREVDGLRYSLEVAQEELRAVQETAVKAEALVRQDEIVFAAAEEALDNLEKEAQSLRRHLKENGERMELLRKEQAAAETLREETHVAWVERSAGSAYYEQRREELTEKLSGLRSELSSLYTEREAALAAAAQLQELCESLSGDSTQREEMIRELEATRESLAESIALKEQQLAEYSARIAELKARISETVTLRMELEGKRTRNERAGQEKNRELLDMERLCARLEQKKMAFEMEERQIVDKLWDNYELSFSAAQALRQNIENLQKSQRQVSDLKRQITALGNPNIGAIEEYERVNERYQFLKEQYTDVEQAKNELLGIITGLTKEMKEIFLTQFRAIEENFRQTFTELFGGGRAALVLEDENDVLNCGIDIRIQPPGKALSTISLLSGGEKAFVAIALYFAIMKVRPTPFCVMDEIEAALDEANVARFAGYLRNMSGKTQFIVITHRRGTMEEADVLYGVTMQEKGVSTVLNVDLEEAERAIEA